MAKDKEKSINPAQQQRKLEKSKALKKGKAELQARRNEKLARRNPDRIQRQIDDLKALEAAGDLKPREKAILTDLERDIRAVQKARQTLGDKAPQFSTSHGRRQQDRRDDTGSSSTILGKRRHDGECKRQDSGSETDESTRQIPWPRDTPPPIPREFRRPQHTNNHMANSNATSANTAPLGEGRSYPLPPKPATAQTTYSSAPQIRDLKKEATSRFVPTVVMRKQEAIKGTTGLLEPEELDRLEREGYVRPVSATQQNEEQEQAQDTSKYTLLDSVEARRLREEEERFERELNMQDGDEGDGGMVQENGPSAPVRQLPSHHVEMEEVEDEDI